MRVWRDIAVITATLSVGLATIAGGGAAPAIAAEAGAASVAGCYSNRWISSDANGLYVSAELGYTGNNYAMLRARGTAVGSWELFRVCFNGGYDTIQSQANWKYVTAELGYSGGSYGMLRARATTVGAREKFVVNCDASGFVCRIISAANGLYTSAELGYTGGNYGMLRARAEEIGPWERFRGFPT
jgi:hypothetical protein